MRLVLIDDTGLIHTTYEELITPEQADGIFEDYIRLVKKESDGQAGQLQATQEIQHFQMVIFKSLMRSGMLTRDNFNLDGFFYQHYENFQIEFERRRKLGNRLSRWIEDKREITKGRFKLLLLSVSQKIIYKLFNRKINESAR